MNNKYLCLKIRAVAPADGASSVDVPEAVSAAFEEVQLKAATVGELVIDVVYSSLNYKDAMASAGNKSIVRQLPHIPGIDAAGTVLESTVAEFESGDSVMVAHADFGTGTDGGFSQLVTAPAAWAYPLTGKTIDARTSMILGTAGFTAAASIKKIVEAGIKPTDGPVAVTGATGGVGSTAILMLASLGYEVIGVTGKLEAIEWLKKLGATSCFSRHEFVDDQDRPLLKGQFAAGIDTVGGPCLETLVKSVQPGGLVTACGMIGGSSLGLTVFPFILRGVSLVGIDSANIDRIQRQAVWTWIEENLAEAITNENLSPLYHEIDFSRLLEKLEEMRNGTHHGRTLIKMG